jgi:hypothetical protein
MSATSRVQSSQTASPYALSPHFIRQLRNFMNNWIVDGGTFRFDGYRTYLRIDKQTATPQILDFPWKLYQEEADVPGLFVTMDPGLVTKTDPSTGNPLVEMVESPKIEAADDTTTIVWLKASVEASTFNSIYKVWGVTSLAVESGETLPADTLDVSANTDGDLFYEIGQVDAVDGAVTEIRQTLRSSLPIVFPLTIVGPATGTHVLTSIDGVVAWTETGPMTCPE